jgi:nucleoside-diphosphate-sugar epimerase
MTGTNEHRIGAMKSSPIISSSVSDILPGIGRVLVTGASGFIGRHLAIQLETIGKAVVRVSRTAGVDITRDDLPLEGVGHVFHAAARIGVVDGWKDPLGYLDVNTFGTARVLEQCRRHGCGMTFIGGYTYGVPQRLPIRESDQPDANNPYALSKYLAEQVCSFYARTYEASVVALRMFNVYGPGQDDSFLIPLIVRQILDPRCSEIEVMDLRPSRDYVYVSDAVDGILLSTRAPPGSAFNLGSGRAYSVEDIIKRASTAAGIHKPYRERGDRRRNEIDRTVADISALHEAAGWFPRVSIDRGLSAVVESMRSRCAA